MDILFKKTNYAKFCMSPSLDETIPESVISREKQLSIDFVHRISIFYIFFLGYINSPVDSSSIINACTIILALTYPKYKSRGKMHFHEK